MRRPGPAVALLMVALMASTSGCMGLIAARESVEFLREPAYESLAEEKITVIHEFTSLFDYTEEFSNRSTFQVTGDTTEINVYFKASFELSRLSAGTVLDNETRYVRATLTDGEGMVQWEQDVSEDASPLEETLQPNPSFAEGQWELDVKARGAGDDITGTLRDNFMVMVTVTNSCVQYPLVEECS